MAVIKDVARLAGVSIGTVSRYLNNPDSLKETTREKVERVVTELNYTPNIYARGLRTQKTNLIALAVRDLSNYFFVELYNAIKMEAAKHGYFVILYTAQEDRGVLKEFLKNPEKINADGIIFAFLDEQDLAESLSKVKEALPTTLITWDIENIDFNTVIVDLCEAIYLSTKHLIELGHERIAYINGIPGARLSNEKHRGFKLAMNEAKLPIFEEYYYEGTYVFGTGFRGARHFAMLEKRPTAIVCSNDIIAIGCTKYLTRKSIAVPREIAVTGVNNLVLSKILEPPLTTVSVPIESMGSEAVNMLLASIDKKMSDTHQVVLKTQLIVRNSTVADTVVEFEF